MKKAVIMLLFSIGFSLKVWADPGSLVMQTGLDIDTADLSSRIGSTMFAFYQVNYHDQLVEITTLRYCGVEDLAKKIIAGLPDLPSFYLQSQHQQLFYDIINKEALMNGYQLKGEEEFEKVSNLSLIQGQAYFLGYLKGYQVALESFFDKEAMQPFCKAAIEESSTYITDAQLVSQGN